MLISKTFKLIRFNLFVECRMLTLYLKLLTFFKKFAQINFTTMYYTHAGIQDFPRVSYTINYLMNNNLRLYIINMSTNYLV